MKKYLFTLLALVALCAMPVRAEKNAAEKNFMNQVESYLRNEGYAPSLDSDGDVKFKYQGNTYYVSAEQYDEGFYVKVSGYMGCEDTNRRAVLEAMNKTEGSLKFLRCHMNSSGDQIIYEVAGYYSNLYQFKQMFPNAVEILDLADQRLGENYTDFS